MCDVGAMDFFKWSDASKAKAKERTKVSQGSSGGCTDAGLAWAGLFRPESSLGDGRALGGCQQ